MDAETRRELRRRRTFAIISHPDAGKTTITEKILLFGGAIQLAGAVKAKKQQRSARSDWIAVEKERGISVSTSVMSFEFSDHALNLLDTPGHNDFSEDTYRTLTAVDSVLMVIDATKGVEAQTKKLLEVCRLKKTPVITFMNKLDLEARDPLALLENVEEELGMSAVPFTWPIGSGKRFKGVYDLRDKTVNFYAPGAKRGEKGDREVIEDLADDRIEALVGEQLADGLREGVELLEVAGDTFDETAFGRGQQTPVFFGSALNNFGVRELLETFCELAPAPQPRETRDRVVMPEEDAFSGFVFKIQANMDPKHRDRMAFLRVVSGRFRRGIKLQHVRTGKPMIVRNAMTFFARDRAIVEEAWPGDIIGIPNHGTIRIADTFSEGEEMVFTGVPNFAPELFRRARLKDPMKLKALQKGLEHVCEEGAAQLFRPIIGSEYVIGALGQLQFEVIEARLRDEYRVDAAFESTRYQVCRWVRFDQEVEGAMSPAEFEDKWTKDCYRDAGDRLCLLTETRFRADYVAENSPGVTLTQTVELA
jgi:peptide chain release factor 3